VPRGHRLLAGLLLALPLHVAAQAEDEGSVAPAETDALQDDADAADAVAETDAARDDDAPDAEDDWDLDAALEGSDDEFDFDAALDGGGDGGDDEFDFDAALDAADEEDDSVPITFSATSTTVGQYRFDNFNSLDHDDEYFSVWERLELNLQREGLRLNARVDAFVPLGESDCPDRLESSECLQNDLRLERFNAHWDGEGWSLDAVDSYAVLGRGLALSMRRVDILGVDTALRGGQAAYNGEGFYFKLLGGAANPQNLDPQTLRIVTVPADQIRRPFRTDAHDWITGGEVGVRLGAHQEVELGVHALRVWFAQNEIAGRRTTIDVGGWHLRLPRLVDGKVSFYGEVNALHRLAENELIDDTRDSGRAVYSSLQASLGNATLLLEWKDYRNYLVAEANLTDETGRIYSAAPTLERADERPRGLHNSRGGRVQLDYGFLPGPWGLSATGLLYGHAEEGDPWDGILVNHWFAKLQKVNDAIGEGEVGWTLDVEGGMRFETYLEDNALGDRGDLDWRVFHFTVETGVVVGEHSLELSIMHRSERQKLFNFVEFQRGTASLTWSWRGQLRLSPVLNWNNEQRDNPSLYPGAEARWDFLEGSFLRVFGGRTPGGRICSGGVCRDVPPFEGVLFELVLRI